MRESALPSAADHRPGGPAGLAALGLWVLFGVANLFGLEQLWGFNVLSFLPPFWTYGALIIVLAGLWPPVSRKLIAFLEAASGRIAAGRSGQLLFIAVTVIVLLTLALVFSSQTTLLGDGTLRKNQIHQGRFWLPTEPLDFLIHAAAYRYIFQPLGLSIVTCYNVLSALCGVAFTIGCFRLALRLAPRQWLILFMLLLSSGLTALFFGYVESYSIVAALLPFIVLLMVKASDGTTALAWLLMICVLAAATHLVALALLPAAVVAVVVVRRSGPGSHVALRSANLYLAMAATGGVALLYLLRWSNVADLPRFLLPLFPSTDSPQAILTFRHALNLANWILIISPLVIAGAVVPFAAGKAPSPEEAGRKLLATWLVIPAAVFLMFFKPQLGGPRDWDLFGLAVFLIIPAGALVFFSDRNRALPPPIIPVLLMTLFTTGGLVAVNADVNRSADRYVALTKTLTFKNLTKEYINLVIHTNAHPELAHRKLEFATAAWNERPYLKVDSLQVLRYLIEEHTRLGPPAWALRYAKLAIATDSLDLTSYLLLLQYYDKYGTGSDRINVARLLEARFPGHPLALLNASVVYAGEGEQERAADCITKAYRLDDADFNIMVNYGAYRYQAGDYPATITIMQKAARSRPGSFAPNYYLALASAALGRPGDAGYYLTRADSTAREPGERQLLQQLREQLGY